MKLFLPFINCVFLLLLSSFNALAEAPEENDFLSLNKETQDLIGIQTTRLINQEFQLETTSAASLVDLSPLFQQRGRYFSQLAQYEIAQLHIKQAQAVVKRLKSLATNQAVSSRKLLVQQNQLAIYLAELKAAKYQLDSVYNQFTAQWGEILTQWFLNKDNKESQPFRLFQKKIYHLYLPVSYGKAPQSIFIHSANLREQAESAKLISAAPQYGLSAQAGHAYFYQIKNSNFLGARVNAWLPISNQAQQGIIIPQAALIWHLGQSFVYLQSDEDEFKRVKINQKTRLDSEHYFIPHGLQENDLLVISGAQVLLSEEFRGQIPAEDDDDDD